MSPNSVCNHTRDKHTNQTPAVRSSDFVITRMITERIGLHSVLLPLLIVIDIVIGTVTVISIVILVFVLVSQYLLTYESSFLI